MSTIIISCPSCEQQNRVLVAALEKAVCGKCKLSLLNKPKSTVTTQTGIVKWFTEEKGYGFIQGNNEVDYFFHISEVKNIIDIKKGIQATFDITLGKKGPEAKNITLSETQMNSIKKDAQVLILGNNRLLIKKIKNYSINSHNFTFRNEVKYTAKGFWSPLFFDQDKEFFSTKSINYLNIQMFDGTIYKVYSDEEANRVHLNTLNYFAEFDESASFTGSNKSKALSDSTIVADTFIYVSKDINTIVKALDEVLSAV